MMKHPISKKSVGIIKLKMTRRALPVVLTPERFTRMALSVDNNIPELANCTLIPVEVKLMDEVMRELLRDSQGEIFQNASLDK